jgi:predicted nucleic acid-binding protein
MIVTDSSALIALLNAEDPAHARCAEVLQFLPAQPLLITVPSFVEAMYFLGSLAALRSRITSGRFGCRTR